MLTRVLSNSSPLFKAIPTIPLRFMSPNADYEEILAKEAAVLKARSEYAAKEGNEFATLIKNITAEAITDFRKKAADMQDEAVADVEASLAARQRDIDQKMQATETSIVKILAQFGRDADAKLEYSANFLDNLDKNFKISGYEASEEVTLKTKAATDGAKQNIDHIFASASTRLKELENRVLEQTRSIDNKIAKYKSDVDDYVVDSLKALFWVSLKFIGGLIGLVGCIQWLSEHLPEENSNPQIPDVVRQIKEMAIQSRQAEIRVLETEVEHSWGNGYWGVFFSDEKNVCQEQRQKIAVLKQEIQCIEGSLDTNEPLAMVLAKATAAPGGITSQVTLS